MSGHPRGLAQASPSRGSPRAASFGPSGPDVTSSEPRGTSSSGSSPRVLSATWRALNAAGADVTSAWVIGEHARVTSADVREAVGTVLDAIRQAVAGSAPNVDGMPAFVPARRVVEALRRSFLDHAEAADVRAVATEVVDVIRGFERVQEALDRDAAHRFAARLTEQDAQQLIVEMAHDMRSPLGSILILAERLRAGAGGEMAPIQQRQLGLIYSAAFGLSAIAGDVIELARGGTTLVDQDAIPFSVSDVLQSILDILRPMAEEKRLAMRCAPPEGDIRVGYPSALNRVLLNLATNAIKFTNAGSVEVICKQIDRSRIEFSVKDTGRGIPPHVIANLYETFRQRQMPGDYFFSSAGLCLSICQKLVRAMGGELEVETELEKGTRFYFALELRQPSRM